MKNCLFTRDPIRVALFCCRKERRMFKECFDHVKKSHPLVHNITNYVTVNDVANIILAAGASPVMSDEPEDVRDITSLCGGLNINIGTPSKRTMEAMRLAGKKTNELGHKLLLDPVGAGASKFRTNTAVTLLKELQFDVIRGNVSELKALAYGSSSTRGVDADAADAVTEENLGQMISFIKSYAAACGCIIAITGAIDLVADAEKCYILRNGRKEMAAITGTGCQLSGLMTAFLIANPDKILEAAAAAVCTMGLAGEIAMRYMAEGDGNSTYRNRIIDAIYNMTGDMLEKGARYEMQ